VFDASVHGAVAFSPERQIVQEEHEIPPFVEKNRGRHLHVRLVDGGGMSVQMLFEGQGEDAHASKSVEVTYQSTSLTILA
jgi:hypothetical protein